MQHKQIQAYIPLLTVGPLHYYAFNNVSLKYDPIANSNILQISPIQKGILVMSVRGVM